MLDSRVDDPTPTPNKQVFVVWQHTEALGFYRWPSIFVFVVVWFVVFLVCAGLEAKNCFCGFSLNEFFNRLSQMWSILFGPVLYVVIFAVFLETNIYKVITIIRSVTYLLGWNEWAMVVYPIPIWFVQLIRFIVVAIDFWFYFLKF